MPQSHPITTIFSFAWFFSFFYKVPSHSTSLSSLSVFFFFLNDTAPTEFSPFPLPAPLPFFGMVLGENAMTPLDGLEILEDCQLSFGGFLLVAFPGYGLS